MMFSVEPIIADGYCSETFYSSQSTAESEATSANAAATLLNWTKDREHIVYQVEGETATQTLNEFSEDSIIRFRALDSANPDDCFQGSIAQVTYSELKESFDMQGATIGALEATFTDNTDMMVCAADGSACLSVTPRCEKRGGGIVGLGLVGTDADERLIGTDEADKINGAGGNDVIIGGMGTDTIDAGEGSDIVYASAVDNIRGGEGGDLIIVRGVYGPSDFFQLLDFKEGDVVRFENDVGFVDVPFEEVEAGVGIGSGGKEN